MNVAPTSASCAIALPQLRGQEYIYFAVAEGVLFVLLQRDLGVVVCFTVGVGSAFVDGC